MFLDNVASLANGARCIQQTNQFSASFHCFGALDDKTHALSAQSNGAWSTYMKGIGASMTVQFAKEYRINRIRLMMRWWQIALIKYIDIEFTDGTIEQVYTQVKSRVEVTPEVELFPYMIPYLRQGY